MDFHLLEDFGKERIKDFQNCNGPIATFYEPFYPQWRKRLATYLYALASRLEPQYNPPKNLASK